MKAHPDYRSILKTLREALKAKGYSYAQLAARIRVSEVTVKRVFSGRSCTMERLISICDSLGVSLLDIAELAKTAPEVDHFLTPDQERHFAANPPHFAILKELARGTDLIDIEKRCKLSPRKMYQLLRTFENLELLDVLPENRFRLRFRGNIRIAHRGPLARKVLRPQIIAFLDHIDRVLENDDVCMHSAEVLLASAHIPEFVEEIHALGKRCRARAFRDQNLLPREKLKSVRWLFGFAPYQTDWDKH